MSAKPTKIRLEEDSVPTSFKAPMIAEDHAPMVRTTKRLARRTHWSVRLFWTGLLALVSLMLGIAFWSFVEAMIARSQILGWVAIGLSAIAAFGALFMILRELRAFGRMRRVDHLRKIAEQNWAGSSRDQADQFLKQLERLYKGREDLSWVAQKLDETRAQALDASALIDQTEILIMAELDAQAKRAVHDAARQVATVTALVPLALADVIAALTANLRMIRRIAAIYGGRTGGFGSWRLIRSIAAHLVATGAVALGDDLISSVAGGGVLSKVSRRFGEGVVNGALTVRVGIAAMDVCRPMPFRAVEAPKTRSEIVSALAGLFGASKNS
ncbi:MAG: TIGR01620 family protein [Pseudomonadota bacterium]